jgi:hypothetical protein
VFRGIVLMNPAYWSSPLGPVMGLLPEIPMFHWKRPARFTDSRSNGVMVYHGGFGRRFGRDFPFEWEKNGPTNGTNWHVSEQKAVLSN